MFLLKTSVLKKEV